MPAPRPRLPEVPPARSRPSSRIRAGLSVHERVRDSGELDGADQPKTTFHSSSSCSEEATVSRSS